MTQDIFLPPFLLTNCTGFLESGFTFLLTSLRSIKTVLGFEAPT